MNNIKTIRETKGVSQKVLAQSTGLSSPFIFDLENGHRNAKPETWAKIAEVLNCTIDELKGGNTNDGTGAEQQAE